LQELLECFVNDDKFTIIPKQYLETMRQQLTILQQSFDSLSKKMATTKVEQTAPAPAPIATVTSAAKSAQERRVTFCEDDIPVVQCGRSIQKDRLTSLLQQYGEDRVDEASSEIDKSRVIEDFNKLFNGTYIFNFSGKGVKVAKYLTRLGVKNCVVVDPVLPPNCPAIHKILYYVNDVIELAEERGDQTINVIADIVNVHRCFFEIFNTLMSSVQQDCWDILQYSCTDSAPNVQGTDFDYGFYLASNPDLSVKELNNETRARSHWTTKGFRAGKVANGKLALTNSNNTIAFAMKSTAFKTLKDNIRSAMASKKEVPFMNVNGRLTKKMMVPNLFSIPLTPKLRLALRCPAECYVSP
jgi:hypothetical protein